MMFSSSICVFLGLLLLRSAFAKATHQAVFRSILRQYAGFGGGRGEALAIIVPAMETALAAALLLPFARARFFAACGSLGFVALASYAIYRRYRGGEKRFACGCSTELNDELPVPVMLIRNCLLLLASLLVVCFPASSVSVADYALGAAWLLAFEVFQTVLVQEGRIRSWESPG